MQETFSHINALVCSISLCVILYYYIKLFLPLTQRNFEQAKSTLRSASVIVAVKNNVEDLSNCIASILSQEDVDFELIIVDDHSEENVQKVVHDFQDKRLRYIPLIKELKGKKAAIFTGIKSAKNEHLVFTDADCVATSTHWLNGVLSAFTPETAIVLGHGRLAKENSLLNALQRFECLLNAIQYFSYAISGNAYMGVGRNLAYLKTLGEHAFKVLMSKEVLSGDDDLLVNHMANNENVAIQSEKKFHTISRAKSNWMSFFHQKRRQLQAGNHYKFNHRLRLAIYGVANVLFYVSCLFLFLFSNLQLSILTIFVLKLSFQWVLFQRLSKTLGDEDIVKWTVFLEPFYYITISMIGISTWLWKVKRWT